MKSIPMPQRPGLGAFARGLQISAMTAVIGMMTPQLSADGPGGGSNRPRPTAEGAPLVQSIRRLASSPTSSAHVLFGVTFSEAVKNFDVADLSLVTTGDLRDLEIHGIEGEGGEYVVEVETGKGEGTVGLTIPASATIQDLTGDALGAGFETGELYTIVRLPPPDPTLGYTFETFDIPGATETLISDIRNDGVLVGRYKDTEGLSHGFIQEGDKLTTFNVTGTTATFAGGIDSSGRVAGFFRDRSNPDVQHGFIRNTNGTILVFDSPGNTTFTYAWRINDAGQVNGYHFENEPFIIRSYRREPVAGYTTNIIFPGSPTGTVARGMNNAGTMAGWKWTESMAIEGVLIEGTHFTTVFTVPGWAHTLPGDINNSNAVAGTVIGEDFHASAGFFRATDGISQVFTVPDSHEMEVFGLNDHGVIVGEYEDHDGKRHGFIARPATILTRGHTDVGALIEDGELELEIHSEALDVEFAPDVAILQLGPASFTTVSTNADFAFLGKAGAPLWLLSQVENTNALFLGLAAEEIEKGVLAGEQVKFVLKAVDGPGQFHLYSVGGFGKPKVSWSTGDGIDTNDVAPIVAGGHADFSWAFSAPGYYRITIEATATLVDGNRAVSSGDVVYHFEVVDGSAKLEISRHGDDEVDLHFHTRAGFHYQVQSAPSPSGPWANLGETIVGDGGEKEVEAEIGESAGFFRVVGVVK